MCGTIPTHVLSMCGMSVVFVKISDMFDWLRDVRALSCLLTRLESPEGTPTVATFSAQVCSGQSTRSSTV